MFVEGGGEFRNGFAARLGVDRESARVLMSALGLQQDRGGSLFAQVSERGVAKLVECPPPPQLV